jgi:hypothetical protein
MQLTRIIDDPKIYSKPWASDKKIYMERGLEGAHCVGSGRNPSIKKGNARC